MRPTTLGPNGPGEKPLLISEYDVLTRDVESSVLIMDTRRLLPTLEAVSSFLLSCWKLLTNYLDPREYSISTKEFVVDDEGKLKGLNTGMYTTCFWFMINV